MLEYFLRIPLSSVENDPGLKAGASDACEVEAVDDEDTTVYASWACSYPPSFSLSILSFLI